MRVEQDDEKVSVNNPFSADVVAAITAHMNDDHPQDTLVICRGVGGSPDATSAKMVSLDGNGGDFVVTVAGQEESLRIPWGETLTQRSQVRGEIVRLFELSRDGSTDGR